VTTARLEGDPALGEAAAAENLVRRYLRAFKERDPEALAKYWADGAVDRFVGDRELVAPAGVRDYYRELFSAFPDFALEVRSVVPADARCAVQWTATGTFSGPGRFQGLAPNGAAIEFEGADFFHVRDGLIRHNEAIVDRMSVARQIGVLPRDGAGGDRVSKTLFNLKARLRPRRRSA
jgi:steroid delta-isomerase-like uncharacterized protein